MTNLRLHFDKPLRHATIKSRINRFIFIVDYNGLEVEAHCPSGGTIAGIPRKDFKSIKCLLSDHGDNTTRRTRYTVEAISLDNGHSYMVVYEKIDNYVSREVCGRFINDICYKMRILLEVKVDEFANSITYEVSKLALAEIGASSDDDVEFINDNLKTFTEVRLNEMIENDEIDEIIENIRFVND